MTFSDVPYSVRKIVLSSTSDQSLMPFELRAGSLVSGELKVRQLEGREKALTVLSIRGRRDFGPRPDHGARQRHWPTGPAHHAIGGPVKRRARHHCGTPGARSPATSPSALSVAPRADPVAAAAPAQQPHLPR